MGDETGSAGAPLGLYPPDHTKDLRNYERVRQEARPRTTPVHRKSGKESASISGSRDGRKMMAANDLGPLLEQLHEKYKDDPDYRKECLYNEITADMLNHMREHDISQAELARRMGVSEAYVSRVFSETRNFTLETLAKIGSALRIEMKVVMRLGQRMEGGSATIGLSSWSSRPPQIKRARSETFGRAVQRKPWAPQKPETPDEKRTEPFAA